MKRFSIAFLCLLMVCCIVSCDHDVNVDALIPKVSNVLYGQLSISCDSTIELSTEREGMVIYYSLDDGDFELYEAEGIDLSEYSGLGSTLKLRAYSTTEDGLGRNDSAVYEFLVDHVDIDHGLDSYAWSEDDAECIVTYVCKGHNPVKPLSESSIIWKNIDVEPTCLSDGKATLVAEFPNSGFIRQEKGISLPKRTYHVYDRQVVDDKYLKSQVTCGERAVYYKSCECGAASTDDTFEYGEPTYAHIYNVLYEWKVEGEGYSCTASNACTKCGFVSQTQSVTASVDILTKDSTCTEEGEATYAASFGDGLFGSVTKDLPVPLKPHVYDQKVAEERFIKTWSNCVHGDIYYMSCKCRAASPDDTFEVGTGYGHHYVTKRLDDEYHCQGCNSVSGCTWKDPETKQKHTFVNYKCTSCDAWDRGPTGGYVFYDCDADNDINVNGGRGEDNLMSSECGWRFLEIAPADLHLIDGVPSIDSTAEGYDTAQSCFVYGYYRNSSDGDNITVMESEGYGIGEGMSNTKKLVAALGEKAYVSTSGSETTANYAARLCSILVYRCKGVDYDDWFLPSRDEIYMMASNIRHFGSVFDEQTAYWQSSESLDANEALSYWMNDKGGGSFLGRGGGFLVRPIRAFI